MGVHLSGVNTGHSMLDSLTPALLPLRILHLHYASSALRTGLGVRPSGMGSADTKLLL